MIKKLILKFYNQTLENICIRIMYFFNTIDTYFLVGGATSFMLHGVGNSNIFILLIITIVVFILFKTADFYPLFLAFTPIFIFFLFQSPLLALQDLALIFFINLGVLVLTQFLFMGISNSIVARDVTVTLRIIWNSIFTIAPTTMSLSVSVYFSFLYTLILVAKPNPLNSNGFLFWLALCIAAIVTRYFKPKSFGSLDFKPQIVKKVTERVVILNIDGFRLDRFYNGGLSFLSSLEKKGSYFPEGVQTVYRALTNPAFASILTGTPPEIHGIFNNNLGQVIKVEALPDLVKTKLYGSMHVKHFSKPHWDTRIVSLPTQSIYKCDGIVFNWLKEDLLKGDNTRLFIVDISEADFLGHAYGSESQQYLEALKRIDTRIEDFFEWIKKNGLLEDMIVIVCSDHGIFRIDHSYLLFKAERYVPCMLVGNTIKPNNPLKFEVSIMDIAPTISYLLGVRYPQNCRGRVLVEVIA